MIQCEWLPCQSSGTDAYKLNNNWPEQKHRHVGKRTLEKPGDFSVNTQTFYRRLTVGGTQCERKVALHPGSTRCTAFPGKSKRKCLLPQIAPHDSSTIAPTWLHRSLAEWAVCSLWLLARAQVAQRHQISSQHGWQLIKPASLDIPSHLEATSFLRDCYCICNLEQGL